MIRQPVTAAIALTLLVAGCGGSSNPRQAATPTSDRTNASSTPEPDDGELTLMSDVRVHYRCIGRGTPAILLEAGTDSAGTEQFGSALVDPLAAASQVCTYDRLGTGSSDGAPDRRRTLDDLCDVEDEVRSALELSGSAVLAGQSGGANLVIWCAARRPAAVSSLVSIEGYHDDPAEMAAEFGKGSWRDNPERMDWVEAAVTLERMPKPIGKFPVLVISASDADPGGAKNQRYWLALSPRSRQVVLQGGHDLHEEVPDKVATEILDYLT
jgi:pimeloyl-ACP methyl ester carboxylesterase